MMQMGFRESTRSGLFFRNGRLGDAESKTRYIQEAEKEVMKLKKAADRGLMSAGER